MLKCLSTVGMMVHKSPMGVIRHNSRQRKSGKQEKCIFELESYAPALLLASTYPDAKRKTAARDESLHKKCLKFNTIFREWESDNQILKPQMEDFV